MTARSIAGTGREEGSFDRPGTGLVAIAPHRPGKFPGARPAAFAAARAARIRAGFMTQASPSPGPASPWRGELLATLRLAWPLAAANLLQMLVYAMDVIFVARLGEEALAASSLAVSLFGLVMWMLSGLTGMVAALIAAELGRRRHAVREVRRSVRMALWLAVGCGIGGMGVALLGHRIMLLTGQQPGIADAAGGFLRIVMFSMIPMQLSNVLRNFVSALGRPIFATAIAVLAIGVSALANYTLVFGHFGAPALGLTGSATSTVLTALFTLACYVARHRARPAAAGATRCSATGGARNGAGWPSWCARACRWPARSSPKPGCSRARRSSWGGSARRSSPGTRSRCKSPRSLSRCRSGSARRRPSASAITSARGDRAAIGRAGWTAIGLGVGFMSLTAAIMLFAPRRGAVDLRRHRRRQATPS